MTREVEARLKISAVDRTGRVLKGVGEKLGYVNGRAEQYNRSLGMMGRLGEAAMGRLMLLGASGFAAAGAGAVYAAREAAKFEQSLFGIQKKSGATAQQMAQLGEEIKELSTQMPVSIDEIASAFERGAAAGIPLDELKEFARLTSGVADAWDTTAENVGNTFAGFTAGMGMARSDLEAFASLINDLADAGIADETGIADFIDRAGASLKNFGMSPEEIAAYGASLLNLKMPAEVAARAMDTVTGKLLAPENLSKKSRNALGQIVGDLDKFQKMSGNQKFTFFIGQLEKLTAQRRASLLGALLGEGFDDEIMRLVSGSEEMRRNLEMARKHVAAPSSSIVDTQVKKLELFNSQMTIMRNNFDVIATDIGEKILPALTDAAKAINAELGGARARGKALENMSPAERGQQEEWFYKRFAEAEGGSVSRRQFNMAYQSALEMVGRGEIADVSDYIERLVATNRYIRQENRPSTGRQGQRVVRPQDMEFPGGGRNLDPYNLPAEGPLPGDRLELTESQRKALVEQYRRYGQGQKSLQYPSGSSSLRPEQVNSDLAGIMRNLDQLERSGAETLRLGDELKTQSEEAGSRLKEGGEQAASALERVADKLLSVVSSINRLGNFAAGGGTGVNANTGRSMPPAAGRPAGTGRQ